MLSVFNAQPGATLLLSPEWVIVSASDDLLAASLTEREVIVGQYLFDAFPDNPDTPEANVRASLEQVLATKQPHEMPPQHYDVSDPTRPGHFVERRWQPRHTPVLNAVGEVQYIIQSVQDITAHRLAEQRLRDSQAREHAAVVETERYRAETAGRVSGGASGHGPPARPGLRGGMSQPPHGPDVGASHRAGGRPTAF